MTTRNTAIPVVSTDVRDKMLTFKPGGPSVEEARKAMLAAKEPVTTTKGGTRIPSFIKGDGPALSPSSRSHAELLASAHAKINELRVPPGSKINLNKMREAGLITQPEIDALMHEANGTTPPATEEPAPAVDVASLIEPETPSVETPAVVPARVPVAPPPQAVQAVSERVPTEPADGRKTIETKHFTGYIYRDGKEWVAEIIYKNGSGTERFTAESKDALMLKVLEGKGHGTVKVRDTVRRMKLGDKPDTWDFFFKQVEESHGLTVEQYNALPEASRALVQDTIQAQQILAFTEVHPEYYATAHNFKFVADWLNKREIPLTLHNLELALEDLTESELLETRPVAAAPVTPTPAAKVPATVVATVTEDSVPVVAAPASAVPTAPAPATPAAPARKRGSTSLIPGSSSAAPSETRPEEGNQSQEPSVSELKRLSDPELKRIATQHRVYNRAY